MGVQITEDVIYGWSHNGAVFPPDEKRLANLLLAQTQEEEEEQRTSL